MVYGEWVPGCRGLAGGYVWGDWACGNGCVARAETLIPGGFAGLFGENGVVFLSRVRWISFRR